jgi:hypothetical protein
VTVTFSVTRDVTRDIVLLVTLPSLSVTGGWIRVRCVLVGVPIVHEEGAVTLVDEAVPAQQSEVFCGLYGCDAQSEGDLGSAWKASVVTRAEQDVHPCLEHLRLQHLELRGVQSAPVKA